MKIILDTDKKTITVPYNYQNKLDEINRMIDTYGGEGAEHETFTGFIDKIWKECIGNSDKCVRTAAKPNRSK